MKPIIKWELKQRQSAILWWTIGGIVLISILFLIYPSIRGQATQLNKVINQLPSGLRNLKTGANNVDVGSAIGYLNSQVYYLTLPLILSLLTISRGSALIGRDELDHTLELLLARPISRNRLLLAKSISGVIEIILVGTIITIVMLVLSKVVNLNIAATRLAMTSLYTVLFALSFGAIAFALTAAGRLTKRAATTVAVIIAYGGYILASLSGFSHYLINPAKVAPYHYFSPDKILQGQAVNGLNIYLLVIFILASLVAYFGFRNRDIA